MKRLNEKGISLIEILAVTVILGLVALVIVPATNNFLIKQREKLYYKQLTELLISSKNWANDNVSKLDVLPGTCGQDNWYKLSLNDLKYGNNISYLSFDFKNPKTNESFMNDDLFVYIYKDNDAYLYCVYSSDCTNNSFEEFSSDAANLCCNGNSFKQRINNCQLPNQLITPSIILDNSDYDTESKSVTVSFNNEKGVYLIYTEHGGVLNVDSQKCSSVEDASYVCNQEIVLAGEQILGGSWYLVTSKPTIVLSENGTVNAKITDGVNYKYASIAVNKIDKTPPTDVDFTATYENNTLTIVAQATDVDSYIYGFKYSLDGGETWSSSVFDATSDFTVSLGNLNKNQTYDIKVKALNGTCKNNDESSLNTTISSKVESVTIN